MVRLLLEDVTLIKGEAITAHIRFKGGATQTIVVPLPMPIWEQRLTPAPVVRAIDELLDSHTDSEIAAILNERGVRSFQGKLFD